MPYMHSESLAHQEVRRPLFWLQLGFAELGLEEEALLHEASILLCRLG